MEQITVKIFSNKDGEVGHEYAKFEPNVAERSEKQIVMRLFKFGEY
jgi:hypothetical protein